ncbi:fasciclin domain protein [Necator americanus]|uniref:Fasciclin domain protein n=1 Tax=Necator americanus TaxID=51031 RepID=W2T519_NECAM|nr:fasciclin domain protein [Necator americanus]ETN76694.1 fasciclin domain protein [Necator americanus]
MKLISPPTPRSDWALINTMFAVSEVYERYSQFRRGAVWAKILIPNIPVQNGVVHIVDNVLGIVSNTIDQLLMDNYRCRTLMRYINTIGQIVRNYFSATGGLVTFFAPYDEAFERIPEQIERRLLRDRVWLEQVLKLHIVPAKELTSDEITNETIVSTVDNIRQLYFVRGEWPKNNITYYVIGGGIKTAIIQDNVAATNGIVHYIERVLGVPYQSLWEILRNETRLQRGAVWAKILIPNIPVQNGVVHIVDNVLGIVSNTIDQLLMDNYRCRTLMRYINTIGQIVRNYFSATGGLVTFFAPYDEAFERIPEQIERRLLRDRVWLEQVLKLHIVPAKELTSDEITNETIVSTVDNIRQLYFVRGEWPKNNITYYVIGGGIKTAIIQDNVAATNGIVHYIERVLGVPYQSLWEILRNETRLQ